jgi:ATP-dependent RNA helicase DeaD
MGRERARKRILESESPAPAMVFCNTKAQVAFLATVLSNFGYDAEGITGDLSQAKREALIAKARARSLRFLVATDVAARGIDIPDLSHVILYEPPEDQESYIHRAGRTGRAGASGVAITLADLMQRMDIDKLARSYKIQFVEKELPVDEDVERVAAERLTALLEADIRGKNALEKERLSRYVSLAGELADSDEGRQLLAMLLDRVYQDSLHKPAEMPDELKQSRKAPAPRGGRQAQGRQGQGQAQDDKPAKKRRRPRRKKKPAGQDGGSEEG